MKKSIILASLLLLLAVLGITTLSQLSSKNSTRLKNLEQKENQRSITIRERIELAKLRGDKQVLAPGTISLHPVAKTPEELEKLLSGYSLILAEPVGQFGYLGDLNTINSWYKFKILDLINEAPPKQTFARRELPQELLPLKSDEFLVPIPGGTVTVEGVKVTQRDQNFPPFDQTKRYLLLVSLDPSTKIAEMALGSQSALILNADNSLNAHSDQQLLQQTIKRFHNSSLDQLKRDKQR
jgi:hypothetical protein